MPVDAGTDDLVGTHIRALGEPVAEGPRRGPIVHPRHDRVVLVEDRRSVGGKRLEQLALGLLHRLERADPGQVDRLHGRHHADRRPGHRRQLRDLAADVHPHLEDGRLVLRAEPQQRQRQPDLVVHVAFGAQRPAGGAQDRRGGLLGRGLGDAPRDADDERREPAAPAGRHGAEGGLAVGHPNDRHVAERGGIVGRPRDEHRGRAPGDRIGACGHGRRSAPRGAPRTAGPASPAANPPPRRGSVGRSEPATARPSGGAGRRA